MPTTTQLAMTRLNVTDAQCEALFASGLQRSDAPTADMVAETISCSVRQLGIGTVTSYCPSLPWRLGIIAFAGPASAWCWFTACQRAPTFESAQ